MSNYISKALNPVTHKIEQVQMWDDWFGQHEYGVRFSDGNVYPENQVVCIHPNDFGSSEMARVSYLGYSGTPVCDTKEICGHHWGGHVERISDMVTFDDCTFEDALIDFKYAIDDYRSY